MKTILEKPAPEIIGDWIHVRVRDPKLFKDKTFRTFDISKSKGIKAVAGKLKKPPAGQAGSMVVQKYLFDKNKWTLKEAVAWVKEHGKSIEEISEDKFMESQDRTIRIEGTKETPAVKVFEIANLKVTKENDLVVIRGYANTKGNKDRYGDIPTVFPEKRNYVYELKEFLKNPVMLLDHTNSVSRIAGSFPEVVEDDIGLRVMAVFSNSDLPEIKHARTVYLEGHAKAFSIAGRWHYEDSEHKDHLTYAEIWHISPVGVGADPNALGAGDTVKPPKKEVESEDDDTDENVAQWKYCICTTKGCGYWKVKKAGEACKKIKCPKCKKPLTGSNTKPKKDATVAEQEWHDDISKEFEHEGNPEDAMARLLGVDGKVEVSGAEKKKIYEHLADHYRELGKESPDFKSVAIRESDGEIVFLTYEETAIRNLTSMREVLKQATAEAGLKDGIKTLKQLLERQK